eukprot:CAMPEP_0204182760 /NCGR_PEP_ID=MMETSP0361-20130328/53012_1 /ASSEMBLY_ACC=CAM_ASM_000343 /TAXON_ID=268821 /ORGANISM="Scrippsiella Hangoei, Strain SHTV-5" /LENGTH=90 /DNA_ID=CAMNT_0051142529 /DNA_START=293 /DNA_END=562 /DNA_ORIENTATION=+
MRWLRFDGSSSRESIEGSVGFVCGLLNFRVKAACGARLGAWWARGMRWLRFDSSSSSKSIEGFGGFVYGLLNFRVKAARDARLGACRARG